jgi:hypothetical protein
MITYNDINALPTTGVTFTIMTKSGIQTYTYECRTSTRLADILNGTIAAMQPGDRIVAVDVNL